MKKEIKGYSKYWLEDGKIISKKFGRQIDVNKDGCVQLLRDGASNWTTVGLKKLIRLADQNYKTYKQIEVERNVKYKPVYNNQNYLFCQEVEDELKVWSVKNENFLTPYYVEDHLRYSLSRKTTFYYKIVWQYYNQKKLKRGMLLHHQDGCPSHNEVTNLTPMTRGQHRRLHNQQV